MRIWFVAGEASGDSHGAHVIEALKRIEPSVQCEGLGGVKMEAAGMKLHQDLASEGIMGFVEVLKHAPRLTRLLKDTARKILESKPDAVVLIDYPGFNIRLAKQLHGSSIPVIYYISPQVWAWKKGRLKTLVQVVTKMLVIFPFEEKLYRDAGLDCVFVGHPLVEVVEGGDLYCQAAAGLEATIRDHTTADVEARWREDIWSTGLTKIGENHLRSGLRFFTGASIEIAIAHLVHRVMESGSVRRSAVAYRRVDAAEAQALQSLTGLCSLEGYLHTIDNFAIRHAWKKHADPISERRRGLVAITAADFLLVPQVTSPRNIVRCDKNDRNQVVIIYEHRINGWIVVAQEERRQGKEWALATMYKRPVRKSEMGDLQLSRESMPCKTVPESHVRNARMRQSSPEDTITQDVKKEKGETYSTGEPMPEVDPALYARNNRKRQSSPSNRISHTHTIGLLPGSRPQEIARLFPLMLDLARALLSDRPHLRFVAPCVNEARAAQLRELAGDFPVEIQVGGMHDVLRAARFCFVASGTATLETALFGVPMIILYRVNPVTYAVARAVVDIKHIGMVNILAGRGVVPEFIQGAIQTAAILPVALNLIDDTPAREQMLADLRAVRESLGGGGASERAAREILATIQSTKPATGGASA